MSEEKKVKKEKPEIFPKTKSIKALRDFRFQWGRVEYDLKEGESYEVPTVLLKNLKTEKVIK